MTNELEKQFFDTFGIEERELEYPDNFTYYPEITDHILLELICISTCYNNEPLDCKVVYQNVESLKIGVLEKVLEAFTVYPIKVKRKVQALFKEE